MIYKLVIRVIQQFCFPDRPMKGGDILDFQKGGNLRKRRVGGGGVDLEKGEYDPPYQLFKKSYHSLKKVTGQNACNFFKRDSSTVAYQQVLRILEEYVLFRTSADGYLGNMPQHTDPPPGVSCFVKTVFVHPEKPISCSFYNCPTPSILT